MNLLTRALYLKLYNDIVELRTNFLLPINTPTEFKAEDDHLHLGLYLSEMVELALASTPVQQMDALVDAIYTRMGKQVHLGARSLDPSRNHSHPGVQAHPSPELHDIRNTLFIVNTLFDIPKFEACWDIIHASNLSKICSTEEDKALTLKHYNKLGVHCKAYKTPKGWIVKATKDTQVEKDFIPAGKFLKNVNYIKADLSKVV